MSTHHPRRRDRFWAAPFSGDTWRRTAYAIVSLPIAIISFVFVVVSLALGTGLLVLFLGVLIYLLAFGLTSGLCRFHRAWARWFLGVQCFQRPRRPRRARGILPRLGARIRDGRTWRELAFIVINLPLAATSAGVAIYVWLQSAYSLSYPILTWNQVGLENGWGGPSRLGVVLVHSVPGLFTLFLGPWLIKAITQFQGWTTARLAGTPQRPVARPIAAEPDRQR